MRKHQIIKINRTLTGRKRWENDQFDTKMDEFKENMDEMAFNNLSKAIEKQKEETETSDEPDYIEIAVVAPTPDYLLRRTRILKPLVTIDMNKDHEKIGEEYTQLFYEKFDIVADLVCQCVRDPENINRKILVPDDSKRILKDQIRISDWNVTIDLGLIQSQGFMCPLPTPVAAAFWVACQMAGFINIIQEKKARRSKKDEGVEDIDAFPETPNQLAEGVEDPLLEGIPELPDGPNRSEQDDTRPSEGQD